MGCENTPNKGGHEHWTRDDLDRPITFQSHEDPVPEFIIKNGLRTLNLSREDFFKVIDGL